MLPLTFKTTPHTRKFGIELEVTPNFTKNEIGMLLEDFELFYGQGRPVRVQPGFQGWADTHANDYWHVKYDSTCGPLGAGHDFGWEVASYIGRSEGDLERMAGAAEGLHRAGLKTNQNCGFHIHIDVADFSPTQIGILIAHWLRIEFCIISACPRHRLQNIYCQLLNFRRLTQGAAYNPLNPLNFWEQMAPLNLNTHRNYDKRYTLNLIGYRIGQEKPYYSRQTAEFRFPACMLDDNHVKNWVRLLLCFVDSVKRAKAPDELKTTSVDEALQIIGLKGTDKFILLDEKLSDTKKWFLKNIQAYSEPTAYGTEAVKELAFIDQI